MRTRNFKGRAFDCWRIQLEENKLNRISKFPELWRLSHIANIEDSEENGSDLDSDDAAVKKQKHRHNREFGGSVARWGAFETISGSAENPEKQVFFKPIIPFFHSKRGGSDYLSSGAIEACDIIGTGGALRVDIPAAATKEHGQRFMAEFAPALGLPPQTQFVEVKRGFQRDDPFVVPNPVISTAPVLQPKSIVHQDSRDAEPDTAVKELHAMEKFISPSEAAADSKDRKLTVPLGPSSGVPTFWRDRKQSQGQCDSSSAEYVSPVVEMAQNASMAENFLYPSGGTSSKSSSDPQYPLKRAESEPLDNGSRQPSRRSSLTMATASSAIKAASGIAKRGACFSSRPRLGIMQSTAHVAQPVRPKRRDSRSNTADQSSTDDISRKCHNIYAPTGDIDCLKDPDIPDTFSDGSGASTTLVHKVLNSSRYEKWAQSVAKVD